ncbi:MAG: hypothetical protein AAGE84_04605 [Cyanobacteria bacterium P01_G01_bin.39]
MAFDKTSRSHVIFMSYLPARYRKVNQNQQIAKIKPETDSDRNLN